MSVLKAVVCCVMLRVESIGKMPHQRADTAEVYRQLADVLEQWQ